MKVLKQVMAVIVVIAFIIGAIFGLVSLGVWVAAKYDSKSISAESTNTVVTIENKEYDTFNNGEVILHYYKLIYYTQEGFALEEEVSESVYNSARIGATVLANKTVYKNDDGSTTYKYKLITEKEIIEEGE